MSDPAPDLRPVAPPPPPVPATVTLATSGPAAQQGPVVAAATDVPRWFLCALLPQACAWTLVAYVARECHGEFVAWAASVTMSSPDWILSLGAPWWLGASLGAALVVGCLLCRPGRYERLRAAAIHFLGLLLTAGLVRMLVACSAPRYYLLKLIDGHRPLAGQRWPLVLLACNLPLLATLFSGAARSGTTSVGAIIHVVLFAAALDFGFQSVFLEGASPPLGPFPWDLRLFFVGDLQVVVGAAGASAVLAYLIWTRTSSQDSWGPWFSLVVSTLTAIVVSRKLEYWTRIYG